MPFIYDKCQRYKVDILFKSFYMLLIRIYSKYQLWGYNMKILSFGLFENVQEIYKKSENVKPSY